MTEGVAAVGEWLRECAREFDERLEELNELDRVLGDGVVPGAVVLLAG